MTKTALKSAREKESQLERDYQMIMHLAQLADPAPVYRRTVEHSEQLERVRTMTTYGAFDIPVPAADA